MRITIYEDLTDDGVNFTVYEDKKWIGTYLGDDIELKPYLKMVEEFVTCDFRS